MIDADIVQRLNKEGLLSAKGKRFTLSMIKWLRYKHRIPAPELKRENELSIKETAHKFGVSSGVVYYWLSRGIITARRTHRGARCWIALDVKKERKLNERVNKSSRIKRK